MGFLKEKFSLIFERFKHFHQTSPLSSDFAILGGLLLLIGVALTVSLSLQKQENQSHAFGTVTMVIDSTPQIDMSKKTVKILVRLIPSGDNPPNIAALKVDAIMKFSSGIFPLRFVSFTPATPSAFPLASSNPSGIPPFSSSETPTLASSSTPPLPTPCDPTVSQCPAISGTLYKRTVSGGSFTSLKYNMNNTQQINSVLYFSVGDEYTKTVSSPTLLGLITFSFFSHTGEEFSPNTSDGSLHIEFGADSKVYILNSTGDANKPFIETPFITKPADFSLDQLLGLHADKTPTPPPLRCGGFIKNPPVCPAGYVCIHEGGVNPDGQGICKPSVTVSPTCTPLPPCVYAKVKCEVALNPDIYCAVTPTVVPQITLQMILACIDLQRSIADPSSNYNSSRCKSYSNRVQADLNEDGWINGIDLNIYFRQHKE